MVELACARIAWDGRDVVLVSIVDMTERHLADRTLRRENAEMEQSLAQLRLELVPTQRDLAAFSEALSNDLQGPGRVWAKAGEIGASFYMGFPTVGQTPD